MLEEPPVLRGMGMPEFSLFFQSWIVPTIWVTLGLGTTSHTPAPLKRSWSRVPLQCPGNAWEEPAIGNSWSD